MRQATHEDVPDQRPSWQMLLVRQLADDLSSGQLELPSFPDVVFRIRRALADENTPVERVVKVVGTEPALAARLLRLANSAALNRSGRPVTDLRTAITRMGANLVRSSALSFAMNQMRHAEACRAIAGELKVIWERSTLVAAVTHAVARKVPGVPADEAMLAGLLHSIGKLYILTRAAGHRAIAGNDEALAGIMASWHANVGKAILESWGLPEEICQAIACQDELEQERRYGHVTLAEVLATGVLLSDYVDDDAGLERAIEGSNWFLRMQLDAAGCAAVLQESREEIRDLHELLAG